jgi:hypothetical protein
VSYETRVKMVHPDWDKIQVEDEVARIMVDTGRSVTNPDTFTGDVGGGVGTPGGAADPNAQVPVPAGG